MSLSERLSALNNANRQKLPAKAITVMDEATALLKEHSISDHILKVGATFPDASLVDPLHNEVRLSSIIKGKKSIVSFYRGGWCPYCNLELRALQAELEHIKALGAQLIAISPETPDNSLSSKEKNELKFQVLSDKNNHLAKELGLVFRLPEELLNTYDQFGIDLEKSQNNRDHSLPLPATFILDEVGIVQYVFADEDYTKRAEPKDLVKVLNTMA